MLPRVLTIAGSDCSGGAGIEADIKTITAHGCYGLTCINALTVQNTQGVSDFVETDEKYVREILEANFSDIDIDVVKTGMLTLATASLLPEILEKYHRGKPLVVDPVLVSTSGHSLSKLEVLDVCIKGLFPKTTLLTPNFMEALAIMEAIGEPCHDEKVTVQLLELMGKTIHEKTGCCSVLIKGGHVPWDAEGGLARESKKPACSVIDVLYIGNLGKSYTFKSKYSSSNNTHGTGCTLASAVSSNLARGLGISEAVAAGINYIGEAIRNADTSIGKGSIGPLNHVYHVAPPLNTEMAGEGRLFVEGHFLDYLLNHPLISPSWEKYTHHPFVKAVAEKTIPFDKFIFFIKQDYAYLINYARVHSLAASVAPDMKSIETEAGILGKIAMELERHKGILLENGVTNLQEIRMGKACSEYNDYLMNVAKTGDWFDINIALAPCLYGYRAAAQWAKQFCKEGKGDIYENWIGDYLSEWYGQSCSDGRKMLENLAVGVSPAKAARLVKIFADVSELEVNFWTAALEHE